MKDVLHLPTTQRSGRRLFVSSHHLTPFSDSNDILDDKMQCSFDLSFFYKKRRGYEHSHLVERAASSLRGTLSRVRVKL